MDSSSEELVLHSCRLLLDLEEESFHLHIPRHSFIEVGDKP
jgi:hypothetical protein